MKVYKDLKSEPMGEVIEELLHTNYVDIIMDKVLKFPVSEKIFHNVNLVSWIFLVISGIIIYFKLADNEILKLLMDLHIAVAVVFTINFLGFVFLAMDRFIIMMRNLLKIDFDILCNSYW